MSNKKDKGYFITKDKQIVIVKSIQDEDMDTPLDIDGYPYLYSEDTEYGFGERRENVPFTDEELDEIFDHKTKYGRIKEIASKHDIVIYPCTIDRQGVSDLGQYRYNAFLYLTPELMKAIDISKDRAEEYIHSCYKDFESYMNGRVYLVSSAICVPDGVPLDRTKMEIYEDELIYSDSYDPCGGIYPQEEDDWYGIDYYITNDCPYGIDSDMFDSYEKAKEKLG